MIACIETNKKTGETINCILFTARKSAEDRAVALAKENGVEEDRARRELKEDNWIDCGKWVVSVIGAVMGDK